MEKAVVMGDSFTERVPVHRSSASLSAGVEAGTPLSAEAEEDLRQLATEFADLCERADSFAQPVRAALLLVASFGDSPPGEKQRQYGRSVPITDRGEDGDRGR